jgi:hypothetical protein
MRRLPAPPSSSNPLHPLFEPRAPPVTGRIGAFLHGSTASGGRSDLPGLVSATEPLNRIRHLGCSVVSRLMNPIPVSGSRCDGAHDRVTLGSRKIRLSQRGAVPTRSTSRIPRAFSRDQAIGVGCLHRDSYASTQPSKAMRPWTRRSLVATWPPMQGRRIAKPERGRSDSSHRLPSSRSGCSSQHWRFEPRNGRSLEAATSRRGFVRVGAEAAFRPQHRRPAAT